MRTGSRVRGGGKFKSFSRGGGRHFSRDLSRLDADGNSTSKRGQEDSSEEDDSEEESSEEEEQSKVGQLPPIADSDSEGEDDAGLVKNLNSTLATTSLNPSSGAGAGSSRAGAAGGAGAGKVDIAQARKDRKAAQKSAAGKKKESGPAGSGSEEDDDDLENANKKTGKMLKVSDLGAPREMSRREKEQADKVAAKERYMKLHAAGKTDEAKADLGRLAEIRKQREQAAARRKAETDARETAAKAALEKSGKRVPLKK